MQILLIATSLVLFFSLILCGLLNPGKIFVKQFFISRESFRCPFAIMVIYCKSLNLHFKVAEHSFQVFISSVIFHHYFLTIYAWCPFFPTERQGESPLRGLFMHFGEVVCCCHVNGGEGLKTTFCLCKRSPVV